MRIRFKLQEEVSEKWLRKNEKLAALAVPREFQRRSAVSVAVKPRPAVSTEVPVFTPMDTKRHILKTYSLSHIEPYINMQMLIGHHLGVKGKIAKLIAEKDEKAVKVKEVVDQLLTDASVNNWISPAAVYQFFPAQSEGNKIYYLSIRKILIRLLKHLISLVRNRLHIYV